MHQRIDTPPGELLRTCNPGPPPPTEATPIKDVAHVVKQRELAAATCRERHEKLATWVRNATQASSK